MLNKTNLLTAKIARDVADDFELGCIKVTPTETIATNGRLLIRVTRPKDGEGEFLLNGYEAQKIAETIDENDWLGVEVKEDAVIIINGDDDSQHTYTSKLNDGKFPNYEKVMPEGEPIAEVVLNVDFLIKLLKQFRKAQNASNPRVLMSIYGHDKQVRLDGDIPYSDQKMCALIMPIKIDSTSLKRDYPVKANTAKTTD